MNRFLRALSVAAILLAVSVSLSWGELGDWQTNTEYGYRIKFPNRWDSQPLPPPMDYKSLGISGEDLEVDKKVTPIRVFKGRDGAEARLFAVDAPDIKECEKIVRTFAKNRRVKGLKKFDKFRNSCRKTEMKVGIAKYGDWRTWIVHFYIASNENGSFLLYFEYLEGRKQYLRDIEDCAKSFGYYKKEKQDNEGNDERIDLPPGWDVYETDHYLIQNNLGDRSKVRDFAKRVEMLNKYHRKVVYPRDDLEKIRSNKQRPKFIIKYFKNHKGFQGYAGDEGVWGAAAYYSPSRGEIAFYLSGWKKKSQGILYHEATHQYLQEFVGGPRVRFHIWINEGLAEYFNGAGMQSISKIELGGKLKTSEQTVKAAIRNGKVLQFKDVIGMTQRQYYRLGRFAYDHGWAMVYFLLHCDNERYNKIVPNYFHRIQEQTFPVLQKLAEEGMDINEDEEAEDRDAKPDWAKEDDEASILVKAQENAKNDVFQGIDLDKLQEEFEEYWR